ncbi:hypothetical protein [Lignipirellula cremea]|uniref:hypothetical protein n=1 Tax=Lignipirellula cremea TaxID=2528010 RepID=UPI001E540A7F|nr:hypothetical protein [Lignipirellula cremea]
MVEQGVCLALFQIQLLKEGEQFTGFVDRQPDTVDLVGDGDEDFDAELAAAEQSGGLSEAIAAPINLIGDQHRPAILHPPRDAGVRKRAVVQASLGRQDSFGSLGLFDFVSRLVSPGLLAFSFPSAGLGLALLLRLFAISLIETFSRTLPLEFFELFLKLINPSLLRGDDIDQPVDRQSPPRRVILELLNVHAQIWSKTGESANTDFTDWTATFSRRAIKETNTVEIIDGTNPPQSSLVRPAHRGRAGEAFS